MSRRPFDPFYASVALRITFQERSRYVCVSSVTSVSSVASRVCCACRCLLSHANSFFFEQRFSVSRKPGDRDCQMAGGGIVLELHARLAIMVKLNVRIPTQRATIIGSVDISPGKLHHLLIVLLDVVCLESGVPVALGHGNFRLCIDKDCDIVSALKLRRCYKPLPIIACRRDIYRLHLTDVIGYMIVCRCQWPVIAAVFGRASR